MPFIKHLLTVDTNGKEVFFTDKKPINADEDFLDDFCNAHSVTDCTGLIPSGGTTDDEIEFYNEIYRFLPEE